MFRKNVDRTWHPFRSAEMCKDKNPEHASCSTRSSWYPTLSKSSTLWLWLQQICGPSGLRHLSSSHSGWGSCPGILILAHSQAECHCSETQVGWSKRRPWFFLGIQHQPFQSRIGVELVELELEVVRSIGSESNVICVFTVGNLGCLQSCHCPMVRHIQDFAQVVSEERAEQWAQRASLLQSPSCHYLIRHLVSVNEYMCTFLVQSPYCRKQVFRNMNVLKVAQFLSLDAVISTRTTRRTTAM